MNATVSALLWCTVQVTLLAAVASLVYLAARRLHPRAGAAAASGGLGMALMLTVLIASPWPRWDLSADAAVATEETAAIATAPATTLMDEGAATSRVERPPLDPALESSLGTYWSAFVEVFNNPRARTTISASAARWPYALIGIFVLGVFATALRFLWAVVQVRRLARSGREIDEEKAVAILTGFQRQFDASQAVSLRESDELSTPATVGWWRPVVILPVTWRTWAKDELRAALAHEFAHITGRDYAWWMIARLALVAHFYHPLVHWLAHRLQLEQELAADMRAASLVGDGKRYLHSLAALALATPPHAVAGPARTLIPTRSLLVRRVEMLRTLGPNRPQRPLARIASFAVVAMVGLGVAGLRGPAASPSVAQAEEPAAPVEEMSPYNFSYVPENIFGLIALRPATIAADPRLQPLAQLMEQGIRPSVPADLVEQVTLVTAAPSFDAAGQIKSGAGEQLVIQTTRPADFEKYLQQAYSNLSTEEHEGRSLFVISPSPHTMSYFAADETTLIGRGRHGLLELLRNQDASNPPADAQLWKAEAKGPAVVVVHQVALRLFLGSVLQSQEASTWLPQVAGSLAPIVSGVETMIFSVDAGEHLQLHGRLICKSPEEVPRVVETVDAVAVILRNTIESMRSQLAAGEASDPRIDQLLQVVLVAINERQISTEGSDVRLKTTFGETKPLVKLVVDTLMPMVESARSTVKRTETTNDLKHLALAMLVYEGNHGSFPPAAGHTYRMDGQERSAEYLHSWRVAILPYLEQQNLYQQYQFDEPWDSEANKKVLAQMPDVFRSPHDEPGSTNTSYFVWTGPETIFHDDEGTRLRDITDGTVHTFLLVEAKRAVPWTKPEDIPYTADGPVPKFGGWEDGEFAAASADGFVRRVLSDVSDETLRLWIGKADRKVTPPLPSP